MSDERGVALWHHLTSCRVHGFPEPSGTREIRANAAVVSLMVDIVDPDEALVTYAHLYEAFAGKPVKLCFNLVHGWVMKEPDPAERLKMVVCYGLKHPTRTKARGRGRDRNRQPNGTAA